MASATQTRIIIKTELDKQLGALGIGSGGGGGAGGEAGSGSMATTGKSFFVHDTKGSTATNALLPSDPITTIDAAVNLCTADRGDRVIVMEGHVETLTAAITMDVAGVSIIGLGSGTNRAQLNTATALDRITVTAANCTVEGIVFNEATAGTQTSCINVAADHCTVRRCQFDLGANETDGAITIASGDFVTVTDCDFNVTADGPGSGVNIEGTSDNVVISGNVFRSVSSAASFDEGAVFEDGSAEFITVENCKFVNHLTGVLPIDLTTIIEEPVLRNNEFVTLDVADDLSGQPRTFYVNADTGNDLAGNGNSRNNTFATIDVAIARCSANNNDTIIVMAGHAETLSAAITMDVAGVSIIGEGVGSARPQITGNGTIDNITITAANCRVSNLYFNESTATATSNINMAAINAVVDNCHFDVGDANNAECITVTAACDGGRIHDNEFIVTGNGPTAAIEIEETGTDQLDVYNNSFVGGAIANAWDNAAINAGAIAFTNGRFYNNSFTHGTALAITASINSAVWGNNFGAACRASADSPLDIWAADGRTAVGDGTREDPTTIVDAVNRATAAGDVVNLLPGTYSVTAPLAMDVAGTVLQAAPGYGRGSVVISVDQSGSDINGVDVTANGCTIRGIRFINSEAPGAVVEIIDVNNGSFTLENCDIDLGGFAASGINVADAIADVRILHCDFIDPGVAGFCIDAAADHMIVEHCVFDLSGATGASIDQSATSLGWVIRNNQFISAGSDIIHIVWDGTPGAGHAVVYNTVTSSTGVLDTLGVAATELSFAWNLQGTTTGIQSGGEIDPSVT